MSHLNMEKKMTKYFFRDGFSVTGKIYKKNNKLYSFQNCWKCDGTGYTPYLWVDNGICWRCGKNGHTHTDLKRVFTEQEIDRLEKNRLVREERKLAKIKKDNEFFIGKIQFYHNPKKFVSKINSWYDFQNKNRDYFSRVLEIGESLTKQYWQKISSNFIELGKHTKKLTLVFRKGFESFYGWSEILKFVDDNNNQYVWFTSSYPDIEVEESYNAKFIVKENQESEQYGKQNMIKNFKVAQ
tara:strand:+ start:214 stop:933 length:720 start_codon:yes stop_codon:yes gene_type:complete